MFPLSSHQVSENRDSHARRRRRSRISRNTKTQPRTSSQTRTLTMLAILFAIAAGSIHVDAHTNGANRQTHLHYAFTAPAITHGPSRATTSTSTGTNLIHAPQISSTSRSRSRSRIPSNSACFHFRQDRSNSLSHSERKEHYNEALLNRFIKGRNSASPLWRRRTKRDAATLGIQRNHGTEQDYSVEDYETYDRPVVPPPTSTIFRASENSSGSITGGTTATRLKRSLQNRESQMRIRRTAPLSQQLLSTTPPNNKLQITTFSKKKKLTQEQHARAKLEWAAKYTSIHSLRRSFGRNRNRIWGDFDNKTTRKLYHTLLPRALLGLYEVGLFSPTDLAPLAFEARVAAKKYARERNILPGRVAAMVYDGFRSWRTWGTWSVHGMSWEQIWNKYETQILEEYMEDHSDVDLDDLQEEITAQICLRILQRSCITNEAVDRMFLEGSVRNKNDKKRRRRGGNAERDLYRIKLKLERDMRELSMAAEAKAASSRSSQIPFEWMAKSPFFLVDVIVDSLPVNSCSPISGTCTVL